MVLVKNPTKRPITVVIAHGDAPKTDVAFHQQLHDAKTGEVATRIVDRRLPQSVTLLGGEERELPGYAKREALAAGLQVVKREEKEERVPVAKDEPKPPEDRTEPPSGLPNALKRKRGAE